MTRAAKIFFDGNLYQLQWESTDFSAENISDELKIYGVKFHSETGNIYVSDKMGYDYQRFSALHERLCPLNQKKIQIDGVATCADLEKKIILEAIPSKKRARFARQRLKMFKEVSKLPYSDEVLKPFKQTRDMLVELVKTL